MKTITLLLITLLLFSNVILAQTDYRNGFIVKNNNDTIVGLLNNNSNLSNYKYCEFKINTEKEKYYPFEIKSYGFKNGKLYHSKEIILNNDSVKLFLECLVKGEINLYKFKTNFFAEKNLKIYDITERKVETENDGVLYYKMATKNRGKLVYMCHDIPKISRKISRMRFNYKNLITTIQNYNSNFSTSESDKINTKPYININIGSLIKLNYSKLDFESSENIFENLTTMDFSKYYISYGITAEVSYPKLFEKSSVILEILKSSIHYNSDATLKTATYTNHNNIKIDQEIINLNIGFKYCFTQYKVKPFLCGGIGNNFLNSSAELNTKSIKYNTGEENVSNNNNLIDFGSTHFILFGGAGCQFNLHKRLGLISEIRYEKSSTQVRYAALKANSHTLNLNIAIVYKF